MDRDTMANPRRDDLAEVTGVKLKTRAEHEVDLVELFFALIHSWKALLLMAIVGALLMSAFHLVFVKPSYRATTELYITNSDSVISLQDLQIGSALVADYRSIITSRAVLKKVIADLQLDISYKELRDLIEVTNPSGTHIINTSVTTSDATLSRNIANDLLNVSIDSIYQIVGTSQPTIIDFSEADAVENVTPSLLLFIAYGVLIGILLVSVFVLLRMFMDNTIKDDDDVSEYLGLPVLTSVPYIPD